MYSNRRKPHASAPATPVTEDERRERECDDRGLSTMSDVKAPMVYKCDKWLVFTTMTYIVSIGLAGILVYLLLSMDNFEWDMHDFVVLFVFIGFVIFVISASYEILTTQLTLNENHLIFRAGRRNIEIKYKDIQSIEHQEYPKPVIVRDIKGQKIVIQQNRFKPISKVVDDIKRFAGK